jgi:tetratricopeptide (TPR) repeat protein
MGNSTTKKLGFVEKLKLQGWLFCLGWVTWYNHVRYSTRCARKVSELYPEHPRMLKKLAGLYLRAERYEDCLEMGLRLTRQRPQDPFAHALVGATYFLLGNLQEQLRHYELAWEYIGNIWNPIKRARGRRAIRAGIKENMLIQEAEGMPAPTVSIPQAELTKAKVKPWMFHEAYGDFLFLGGRTEEAFEQFKKEAEMAKWRAFPYMRMGQILVEWGKHEQAVRYLRRALWCIRQRRVRPYVRVWLAYSYLHLGMKRRSRYHLWKWEHLELARGGNKDRIRAACVYRALGVLDYLGRDWLKKTFRSSPDPDLLIFLRKMEKELALKRMSIKELGDRPELYEIEPMDTESIAEDKP